MEDGIENEWLKQFIISPETAIFTVKIQYHKVQHRVNSKSIQLPVLPNRRYSSQVSYIRKTRLKSAIEEQC